MFKRLAIVDRGAAAMRLIHAVNELGDAGDRPVTIALHTESERHARFVREADEAVLIGGSVNPYLDDAELERALAQCQADVAWPGWGVVSRRPEFAELCERIGVTFVGPSASVMRELGHDVVSRKIAAQAGVAVVDRQVDGARHVEVEIVAAEGDGSGDRPARQVGSAAGPGRAR